MAIRHVHEWEERRGKKRGKEVLSISEISTYSRWIVSMMLYQLNYESNGEQAVSIYDLRSNGLNSG